MMYMFAAISNFGLFARRAGKWCLLFPLTLSARLSCGACMCMIELIISSSVCVPYHTS